MSKLFSILFFISFLGCQLSDKAEKPTYSILTTIDTTYPSATNEQLFFKSIYKKYSGNYYELGSNVSFYEIFDTVTKKAVWKVSFIPVNDNGKDEKKYLIELNDPILKKYMPSTHFYYGKHSCHYELSVNGLSFIGFLNSGKGDFISDTSASGLKTDFVNIVKGKIINGKEDKQKLCIALLTVIKPELLLREEEYKPLGTKFNWENNTLTVTNNYEIQNGIGSKTYTESTNLYMTFNQDTVTGIGLSNNK